MFVHACVFGKQNVFCESIGCHGYNGDGFSVLFVERTDCCRLPVLPFSPCQRRNCYGFKLLLIHCAVLEPVNILRLFQPAPDIFRGKGLFQGKLTGNRLKLRRHSCHNLITWLTSLRFSCICISPLPLIYRNRSFSI